MANNPLDLTEQSFLGATLVVGSAVLSVIGVAGLFWKDPVVLVGIAAGAAWGLCIALLVFNSLLRRRVKALEIDLAVERERVDRFARTADNVSQSVLTVLNMAPAAPPPPRRRRTAQAAAPAQPQQGDEQ